MNLLRKIRLLAIALLFGTVSIDAYAQQPQYITYSVQSGTGFFVNHQNIITNAHVIKGCNKVTVKGAIPEHDAVVKYIDEEHDLAVLETNMPPPEFAPLRYNIDELKPSDRVMVVGYPGEAGARGEYHVATAEIKDIKTNDDSNKWLYITDVLEHGNSGGPVFDMSGNVIGVVVAKAIITYSDAVTHATVNEQNAGVVITLKTLNDFLYNHGVFTEMNGSGYVFTDSYLEERARNYIVNVQCRIRANDVPTSQYPQ